MAKFIAPYRIYVIRCWEERCSQASTSIYRFTLEIPGTGERFGFTSPEELINALKRIVFQIQTQELSDSPLEDELD